MSSCCVSAAMIFLNIVVILTLAFQGFNVRASTHSKFLILGAGAAGVSCADELVRSGETDFVILEARDYMGGRIRNGKIGTTTIEYGANWIHGIGSHNAMWQLKQRFGVSTVMDNYTDTTVRDENGQILSQNDNNYNEMLAKTNAVLEESYEAEERNEPDVSLSTSLSRAGLIPDSPVESAFEYLIVDYENAAAPEQLTARQTAVTGGKGVDHFVKDQRGYNYIIRELAQNFTDHILFNTTVTKINHSSQGITVETNNTITYTADYLIVTFSNGVLARRNLFSPEMPQWKYDAISLLPMGYYTKIFLRFPTKFWDSTNYSLLSNLIRGHYVVWMNLKQTGFFESENLLLVTVTGAESLRVERLTNDQVQTEVMEVLRRVYGAGIPDPTDLVMSRWSTDPYAHGVYVAPTIGADSLVFEHMNQPISNNKIWFAGEALSEKLFGYTHGAIEVGRKQTSSLLKCISGNACPFFRKRNSTCAPEGMKSSSAKVNKISLVGMCFVGVILGTLIRLA